MKTIEAKKIRILQNIYSRDVAIAESFQNGLSKICERKTANLKIILVDIYTKQQKTHYLISQNFQI